MASNNTHIVTALVANKAGVLNRISGLFSRRGYNIESLSVASTEDEKLSRMTIVVNGDDYVLDQITKQLNKIFDAKHVTQLVAENSVMRELLLVKIRVKPEQRPELETTVNIFKAKTVDIYPNAMTLELTGEQGKIDGFIRMISPYGIIEMARTGITALERGEKNIMDS